MFVWYMFGTTRNHILLKYKCSLENNKALKNLEIHSVDNHFVIYLHKLDFSHKQ